MTTSARRHPTMLSLAVIATAGAVWFGLASATGLIFHLMPAAPSIAGAWVLSRGPVGSRSRFPRAATLLFGALTASTVALLLSDQRRPLDDP